MKHEETLRALLAPLGVYRWEGTFQWKELQSEGGQLDAAADLLAHLQQEMNLWTAQEEGLDQLRELMNRPWVEGESREQLRQALVALLRIDGSCFTLEDMNNAIRGCGIFAVVEEKEAPLHVQVSFPEVGGEPEGYEEIRWIIENILPCHLEIEYAIRYMVWPELEQQFLAWTGIEEKKMDWETLEKQILLDKRQAG